MRTPNCLARPSSVFDRDPPPSPIPSTTVDRGPASEFPPGRGSSRGPHRLREPSLGFSRRLSDGRLFDPGVEYPVRSIFPRRDHFFPLAVLIQKDPKVPSPQPQSTGARFTSFSARITILGSLPFATRVGAGRGSPQCVSRTRSVWFTPRAVPPLSSGSPWRGLGFFFEAIVTINRPPGLNYTTHLVVF